MIEQNKTPAEAGANNNTIITNEANAVQKDSFLTTKVSDPMRRSGALVKVIHHYYKDTRSGLDLITKVQNWNDEYLEPPFSEDDIKVYLQFFLQGHFSENQNDKSGGNKSKQILDCIKESIDLKLFHDQNRVPYAQVRVGAKLMNLEIISTDFQNYVRRIFYKKTGNSAQDLVRREA